MIVERESSKVESYLLYQIHQLTVENLSLSEFTQLFDIKEKGKNDNIEKIILNIPECEELVAEFNIEKTLYLKYEKSKNKINKQFDFIFTNFVSIVLFFKYLIKKDAQKYGYENYLINVSIYKNEFNKIEIFIAHKKRMTLTSLKNYHLEFSSLKHPPAILSLTFNNLGNIKYYLNKILIRRIYTSEHLFHLNTPSFKKFRE